jgi:hypothetical protein
MHVMTVSHSKREGREATRCVKVKRKRVAADYLDEIGWGDKPDAEDPEEDEGDNEGDDWDRIDPGMDPGRRAWRRFDHGPGGPYCIGECGLRHLCQGKCRLRVPASFEYPCPWEARGRLCESCTVWEVPGRQEVDYAQS